MNADEQLRLTAEFFIKVACFLFAKVSPVQKYKNPSPPNAARRSNRSLAT
jgi:hypothetical protein